MWCCRLDAAVWPELGLVLNWLEVCVFANSLKTVSCLLSGGWLAQPVGSALALSPASAMRSDEPIAL